MKTLELTSEIEHLEAKGAHVERLLEALGNPSEWTYTGQVIDAGRAEAHCACTHEIRFCFVIEHPTKGQTHVGSTCINHIAAITPELGKSLLEARAKLEEQLKEAKATARRAQADAENAALWVEYQKKRDLAMDRHRSNREAGRMSPRDLWYFSEGWREKFRVKSPPAYQRPGDLKRWLNTAIARINRALEAVC